MEPQFPQLKMQNKYQVNKTLKQPLAKTSQATPARNPRPSASRLTSTYLGHPADFDTKTPTIGTEVQARIDRILAMTDEERSGHYTGALRLHRYTHEVYRWFATLRTTILGYPVRRYFTNYKDSVVWLELVRERWQQNIILHNIPLGGVSRDSFRMPWQAQSDERGKATVLVPAKNGWSAERRARLSAAKEARNAHHSVDPSKQKQGLKPRATTSQVLGVNMLPMPGNKIKDAFLNGSTAAVSQSSESSQK
jgi:hypothetical protein